MQRLRRQQHLQNMIGGALRAKSAEVAISASMGGCALCAKIAGATVSASMRGVRATCMCIDCGKIAEAAVSASTNGSALSARIAKAHSSTLTYVGATEQQLIECCCTPNTTPNQPPMYWGADVQIMECSSPTEIASECMRRCCCSRKPQLHRPGKCKRW